MKWLIPISLLLVCIENCFLPKRESKIGLGSNASDWSNSQGKMIIVYLFAVFEKARVSDRMGSCFFIFLKKHDQNESAAAVYKNVGVEYIQPLRRQCAATPQRNIYFPEAASFVT